MYRSLLTLLCLASVACGGGPNLKEGSAPLAPPPASPGALAPLSRDTQHHPEESAPSWWETYMADARSRQALYEVATTIPRVEPIREVPAVEDVLGPLPRFEEHLYFNQDFQLELDRLTASRLTSGNTLTLLPDSTAWARRLELIHSARERVYVSTMLMHCDESGMMVRDALVAAAARGVDTRLVIDGLFTVIARPCLQEMEEGGVKIAVSRRSRVPGTIDWEMHDKLFYVDDHLATIGGQNIGDVYARSDGFNEYYRDLDMLVEGPAVIEIGRRFLWLWRSLRPEDPMYSFEEILTHMEDDAARRGLVGQQHYARWLAPEQRKGICRFVAQDPYMETFHVFTAYTRLTEAARARVMLHAYSIEPVGTPRQDRLRDALVDLGGRPGGRVDVVTNGPGIMRTVGVPESLSRVYAVRLLNSAWKGLANSPVNVWGTHFYLHAKAWYFDGVAAAVGSFNYDNSGNECQESTLICIDPSMVREVEGVMARDIANSTRLPMDQRPPPPEPISPQAEQVLRLLE